MLKNWKDKILSFAAAVMLACGGAAAVNTVKVANNNDINSGDVVSSMDGLFEGVEFGWVSSNVVSGKAEDVATEEPSLEIVSQNMQFQSKLYLMFAVHKANTDAEVKMLYWVNPQTEYTIETNDEEVSKSGVRNKEQDRVIEGKPCEIFNFPIRSTDMARVIYARAYVEIPSEDGTTEIVYSDTIRYSAIDYVYKKKADGVEHTYEKLLDAMLVYGASAQIHFGLDKADLEGTEENAAKYVAETERVATDDYYMVTVESGALSDGFNSGRFTVKEKIDIQAPEENEEGLPFLCWQDQVGNYYYEDEGKVSLNGIKGDTTFTPVYDSPWAFDDAGRLAGYKGASKQVVIPKEYYDVKAGKTRRIGTIAAGTFDTNTAVESIIIEEGVIYIHAYAFRDCPNLKSISIPSTITSLAVGFALDCQNLEEIIVNEANAKFFNNFVDGVSDGNVYQRLTDGGVTLLQYAAGKANTTFEVPNFVTNIAASAFRGADALQEVYIHKNVTVVGTGAFRGYGAGLTIYVEGATFNNDVFVLPYTGWKSDWIIGSKEYHVENWILQ